MKLSYDYIVKYFKENKVEVITKRNQQIDSKSKLIVKDIDGYFGLTSFDFFREDKSFKPFSTHNPYTIRNIHLYIDKNNIGVKILSKKYDGLNCDLLFECSCGNTFKVSWHHFKCSGQTKCRDCNVLFYRCKRANPFDNLQVVLDERGYCLIDGEYLNNKSKLHVVDKIGYKGITCYSRLKQGIVPMKFHNKNPYTLENIRTYININNINCELISTKYKNNKRDKLEFACGCGEHFFATLDYFIRAGKTRCEKCMNNKSNIELKTENWLIENSVNYIFQYRIEECRYKRALPFDFAILKDNSLFCLIEVDGSQHDAENGATFFSKSATKEDSILAKERDKIKTNYCKNNKIKLLRLKQFYFRDDRYIKELKSFIFEDL